MPPVLRAQIMMGRKPTTIALLNQPLDCFEMPFSAAATHLNAILPVHKHDLLGVGYASPIAVRLKVEAGQRDGVEAANARLRRRRDLCPICRPIEI